MKAEQLDQVVASLHAKVSQIQSPVATEGAIDEALTDITNYAALLKALRAAPPTPTTAPEQPVVSPKL